MGYHPVATQPQTSTNIPQNRLPPPPSATAPPRHQVPAPHPGLPNGQIPLVNGPYGQVPTYSNSNQPPQYRPNAPPPTAQEPPRYPNAVQGQNGVPNYA